MALAALAFFAASAVHFGLQLPLGVVRLRDPFFGAAIPEAALGVVLGLGAVAVLIQRPKAKLIGLTTTSFTLLVVLYGLSITLRSGRLGDVAYHLALLLALLLGLGLLTSRGTAGVGGPLRGPHARPT
jgi:hypothetical protein